MSQDQKVNHKSKDQKSKDSNNSSPKKGEKNDDGTPILQYGKNSNLAAFKEFLQDKTAQEYGLLSRIFLGKPYIPDEPDNPTFQTNTWTSYSIDRQSIEMASYLSDLKEWEKDCAELRRNTHKLFGMISRALSDTSKERIQARPEWESARRHNRGDTIRCQ